MSKIITVPFGWLLGQLYALTTNYGVAMILFALIVQTVLLPIRAKSKKSMMKMSRLQPRIQEIQKKYENDKQKQNEAIQKLQQEEGASMGMVPNLCEKMNILILELKKFIETVVRKTSNFQDCHNIKVKQYIKLLQIFRVNL